MSTGIHPRDSFAALPTEGRGAKRAAICRAFLEVTTRIEPDPPSPQRH
jgi:hypothetical protein